jgi:hypothetical protein
MVSATLPVTGERDELGRRQGSYRYTNESGQLVATATYRDDRLHGPIVTYHRGTRVAEMNYVAGLPHGPYRRAVHEGMYTIDAARWEEGAFSAGAPCGRFRLRAENGNTLLVRNFGRGPLEDDTMYSCLRGGGLTCAADWFHRARALCATERVAEGLVCIARGVGSGGDPEMLRLALGRIAMPVTPEEAERRASAARTTCPRTLFAALLRGAHPIPILRRLALVASDDASAAFLQASVVLREWPISPIIGRALRNLRGGDPSSVLADARTLLLTHRIDARILGALALRAIEELSPDSESPVTLSSPLDDADPPPTQRRWKTTTAAAAAHA